MPEQTNEQQVTGTSAPQSPLCRRLGRLGCGIALVLWFTLLLTPCLAIALLSRGQITISQGSVPEQQIRVWLIQEPDLRGLGFSSTSAFEDGQNAVCIQTNVNYLLWQGEGDPAIFCDCYERPDTETAWSLASTASGQCPEGEG